MAAGDAIVLRGDVYGDQSATDATPLLIAHGLFGSAANWRTAAKRFGAARRTFAVDMRNHGDSPWAEPMDYETMGADLLAAADQAFGRPAILLGHSMGGKAAMAAALAEPDKVAGLIIVDMAPIAYDHPEHRQIAQAMLGVDLGALTRRSEADAALAEAAPDPAMRAFLLQNLSFDGEERRARWRPNVALVEKTTDEICGWPGTWAGRGYAGPVLSISGGQSKYVRDEGRAALLGHFTRLETEVIDEAGHWPHAEAPDAFLAICDRFLAANG